MKHTTNGKTDKTHKEKNASISKCYGHHNSSPTIKSIKMTNSLIMNTADIPTS